MDAFRSVSLACLAVASLVALVVLAGWMIPGMGSLLWDGWNLMQANTALCVLLLAAGEFLIWWKHDVRARLVARTLAIAVILITFVTFYVHVTAHASIVGRLLASGDTLSYAYPMSLQSALSFLLLGLALGIDETSTDVLGFVLDILLIMLIVLNLLFVSGYLFGAMSLVGQSAIIRISPQTLLCVLFLTVVRAGNRAPYGVMSVLISIGGGGHLARLMLPLSIVISFSILSIDTQLQASGALSPSYATALSAAGLAFLLIVVVFFLAQKLNSIEAGVREMSLSDELTGIYNRRGFFFLGNLAMRSARRTSTRLSLLFFDVDGLKDVNDTLGHAAGSQLLHDIAGMIRDTFRSNDIVARVGGDEFAVIAHDIKHASRSALSRLEEKVKAINDSQVRPYIISYSVGEVTIDPQREEALDVLLEHADKAMYQDKKRRRVVRNPDDMTNPMQGGDLPDNAG